MDPRGVSAGNRGGGFKPDEAADRGVRFLMGAEVDLVEAGLLFMMAGSAQGDGCQDPQDAPDE